MDRSTQAGDVAPEIPKTPPYTLADYSAEEQRDMPYEQLTKLRRQAYRDHVAAMADRDELEAWAAGLTEAYGPAVKVHHNAVGWAVAFLIARYGEEPVPHWPTSLSQADRTRMAQWATSPTEFSTGVRPLGRTITPRRNEALFGLEEFGDAITVVLPAPAKAVARARAPAAAPQEG